MMAVANEDCMESVTLDNGKEVEHMLNNLPRKRLDYRIPNQVWREAMDSDIYRVAINA
jgi:IS30 family transposase